MTDWLDRHLLPCFFKSTFGVDCPGCGMQRSLIALLKGHLIESLYLYPAILPFFLTLFWLFIHLKLKHPKGAAILVGLFILTALTITIQFVVKQYFLLKVH